MRLIASYILYTIGDCLGALLMYDCMSWLYPAYRKIMLLSCDLDHEKKLWKEPK